MCIYGLKVEKSEHESYWERYEDMWLWDMVKDGDERSRGNNLRVTKDKYQGEYYSLPVYHFYR